MIKFFSKYKIIFYFSNFFLVFLYIFPGSLLGVIMYDNKNIQPQITPDFIVSSNHFYVFVFISTLGFLSFIKQKQTNNLIIYCLLPILLFTTSLAEEKKIKLFLNKI